MFSWSSQVLVKLTYEHARKICKTGSDIAYDECCSCTTGIRMVLHSGCLFASRSLGRPRKPLLAGYLRTYALSIPFVSQQFIIYFLVF